MRNDIDAIDRRSDRVRVSNVSRNELDRATRDVARNRFWPGGITVNLRVEIVQDSHHVILFDQGIDEMRTDEPGSARYENSLRVH